MGGQAGRGQLACALTEHGLDSLHRLRPSHGARAAGVTNLFVGISFVNMKTRETHLICGLQGGGKIHESLDLDAVSRTHVGDVVEVGGGADHLGPTIRIPVNTMLLETHLRNLKCCKFSAKNSVEVNKRIKHRIVLTSPELKEQI